MEHGGRLRIENKSFQKSVFLRILPICVSWLHFIYLSVIQLSIWYVFSCTYFMIVISLCKIIPSLLTELTIFFFKQFVNDSLNEKLVWAVLYPCHSRPTWTKHMSSSYSLGSIASLKIPSENHTLCEISRNVYFFLYKNLPLWPVES